MPPTPTTCTNALDIYTVDTFMTPAKQNTTPRSAQPCLPAHRHVANKKIDNMPIMFSIDLFRRSSLLGLPILGQTKSVRQDREPFQLKFRQQVHTPDSWIPRCLSLNDRLLDAILDDLVDEIRIDAAVCSPAKKQRIGYEPVKPPANMLQPRPHCTLAFDY